MNQVVEEAKGAGPQFKVNIEGTLFDWDSDTITVPEIRELGSLPDDQPVIQVDLRDNTERTLDEDEVVELRPGVGFTKKVGWKRGLLDRVEQELALLRVWIPELEYLEEGHWVRIPEYVSRTSGWGIERLEVCFQIPTGVPAQAPYGFYVRPGLVCDATGAKPGNYKHPLETPFGGGWGRFSWQLESWEPAEDPRLGTNMINFVESFAGRLADVT